MNQPLRYRTGNQPEEFEIRETYLGWQPNALDDWYAATVEEDGITSRKRPFTVTLRSSNGQETVSILVHQTLIKDAFPLEIFNEERAEDWSWFAIVSLEGKPEERFIIPLH